MKQLTPYILLMLLITTCFACSDEEDFTTDSNARITFSEDTISFDTVFSTIGSATESFQVYNDNDKAIRMKTIRLASGGKSGFHINVDGQSGTQFVDVDILKHDSIFVFVEVNVNPHDADSPILVRDSLQFFLDNGRCQQVILEAYGQDIIILRDSVIKTDTTLSSTRPFVIYDSLVVSKGATLTLAPGTTLCFHSEASLDVHGRIIANGTLESPVTLRGDRTDKMFWYLPYDRIDGQWGGINITRESEGNVLDHVDIHGGAWGIFCDSTGVETTKLTLLNSTIHNVQSYGLYSQSNKIRVANSQITNAGGDCLLLIGGDYEFYHTTVAQFYPWDADRGKALSFASIAADEPRPLQALKFYNCILTGYEDDVISGEKYANESEEAEKAVAFNVMFTNCLLRTDTVGSSQYFTDCVLEDEDSVTCGTTNFKTIDTDNYIYDFQLDSLSRARHIGNPEFSRLYARDKKGTIRSTEHPDAGCFEY